MTQPQATVTNYPIVAETIMGYFKKSAQNFYKIGVQLKSVKEFKATSETAIKAVAKEYSSLIELLPFEEKTANEFIQIANDPFIKKNLDVIPASYNTMYDLKGLSAEAWTFLKVNGLNSASTGTEVKKLKSDYQTSTAPKETEDTSSDTDTPDEAPTASNTETVSEKLKDFKVSDTSSSDVKDDDTSSETEDTSSDTEVLDEYFENLAQGGNSKASVMSITVDFSKANADPKVGDMLNELCVLVDQLGMHDHDAFEVDINSSLIGDLMDNIAA